MENGVRIRQDIGLDKANVRGLRKLLVLHSRLDDRIWSVAQEEFIPCSDLFDRLVFELHLVADLLEGPVNGAVRCINNDSSSN